MHSVSLKVGVREDKLKKNDSIRVSKQGKCDPLLPNICLYVLRAKIVTM